MNQVTYILEGQDAAGFWSVVDAWPFSPPSEIDLEYAKRERPLEAYRLVERRESVNVIWETSKGEE